MHRHFEQKCWDCFIGIARNAVLTFWNDSAVNVAASMFVNMGHNQHITLYCCLLSLCVVGYILSLLELCYLWNWTWKGVFTNPPSLLFFHVLHGGADSVARWRSKRLWKLELLAGVRYRMWNSAAWKVISEGFSASQSQWLNSRRTFSLKFLDYSISEET